MAPSPAAANILLLSDETHREIPVNVVVAVQSHLDGTPILDQKGKDISTTAYVTSRAPGSYGVKIRRFYRSRWGIENQGFRSLSQTWNIDRPAGHTRGAVLARLVFVFMIYNAGHLFEKQSRHRPDYAEHLRHLRSYGAGLRLAGASIVVLTDSGFCCGISARDLLRLQKQRIQRGLQRDLAAGRSLEEALKKLETG